MKRLLLLSVILFTVLFSYTDFAQELKSLKKDFQISFPEKIQKLVLDPLPAGTYSIGAGGNFATIQNAFHKLSTDGIAGEVILELIDNLYTAPTNQYGFFLDGPIPGAGPNSRVIIKPAANKNVTIEGNGLVTVSLLNTSYVTIDGVALTGSTTLTIHTLSNNTYDYNDGIDFASNSDHNVMQNIVFINEAGSKPSGSGFVSDNLELSPDGNLIQNNFVKKSGVGLYAYGNPDHIAYGNIFRGNIIGTETDSSIAYGIIVYHSQNTIIENNIIQNLRLANVWDAINGGICSFYDSGNIIRNNIVHNIKSSTGYSSVGILLSGKVGYVGSNNSVYNNMIYDIQSTSTQSNSRVTGIQMLYQNNPKIYYNSVYLSGTGANHQGSAALFINNNCTDVDARNNILVNTRDESPYCASSIYDYSASNLTSNFNDLFYEDTNNNNCLVKIGTTNYHTLADWQATGKDLNSITEMPHFVSPDLHIDNTVSTLLDGHAIPITGITTDIDNDSRDLLTPDIGADEFELMPNTTNWQMQNSNLPANAYVCCLSAVNDQVCWGVAQIYPPSTIPYAGYIRTTDGGSNWVCDTIAGISNGYFQLIFAIDADTAYATVYVNASEISKGIYKTTNGGSSWNRQNAFNASQYGPGYVHFFDSQNGVVIGDPNLETYTTTNGGLTWNPVVMPVALSGEFTKLSGNGITASGDTVWFSTGARLFKSTDRGYTWTIIISEPQYLSWWPCIAFQNSLVGIYSIKLAPGGLDHLFRRTTDGGVTWITLSNSILNNLAPTALQHLPGTEATYIIGGGMPQGMRGTAVSYDAGESWSIIDTSANFQISFPSYIIGWSSQYTTNVVRKYVGPPLSVEEEQIDEMPTGYSLSQNYPNPFNPSTTFSYSIPNASKVIIKVYDVLGKEIETLLNEEKPASTYELTWYAEQLPSGVYFYQMKAGSFVETKKMLLLK